MNEELIEEGDRGDCKGDGNGEFNLRLGLNVWPFWNGPVLGKLYAGFADGLVLEADGVE